ncbi:peptidoglycan-binding domain-containing protein [Streptomyces sp. NPDC006314]|uniref:peptidoglycan-binding domain-containing protein n=1 Tax=Streptomyces sp. NPDC006314 TaxID=3154475 RepID=UPI0033B52AAD
MPTPPEPEPPHPGPVLEPVRVLRLRRFDALAELMREMRPDPVAYEPVGTPPGPHRTAARPPAAAEEETRELPPVPAGRPRTTPTTGVFGPGLRRAAVAVAVVAAALAGFGCALLLPGRQEAAATPRPTGPATTAPPAAAPATPVPDSPAPTASAAPTAADPGAPDPDGPGTLRQGDTGPEVTDLQERLLSVPDVYRGGSTSGTYDTTLTEAVARFQLWYGISGDETGVYGNDTRRALESRTGPGDDS